MRIELLGSWVISLHEFGEVWRKVGCWVEGVVLVVESVVSFWGDEGG